MTTRQQPRNGWHEFARWLFMSKWGVRILLLVLVAIMVAAFWQFILNVVFTMLTLALVLAVVWAIVPRPVKKMTSRRR